MHPAAFWDMSPDEYDAEVKRQDNPAQICTNGWAKVLTLPEALDAAAKEIDLAKREICAPVDNRLIDAVEMLHAAVTLHIMNIKDIQK